MLRTLLYRKVLASSYSGSKIQNVHLFTRDSTTIFGNPWATAGITS